MLKKLTLSNFAFVISLSFIFVGLNTEVNAVSVSPPTYYLDLENGQSKTESLKIFGDVSDPADTTLYIAPFVMVKEGQRSDRQFLEPNPDNNNEVANWIELSQTTVEVGPNTEVEIPWTITSQGTAECGTNLAAIIVSQEPFDSDEETPRVDIGGRVAAQVHVDVESKEGDSCDDNTVDLNAESFNVESIFYNYDGTEFTTVLRNDGNLISRAPKGFITVKGLGEDIQVPFNEENVDVYPNSSRIFEEKWIDSEYPSEGSIVEQIAYEITNLRIGRYTAQLGVTNNVDSQIIAEDSFWIIPWRLILLILLFLSIVIGFVLYVARKEKK
jgi:hypothetical protein